MGNGSVGFPVSARGICNVTSSSDDPTITPTLEVSVEDPYRPVFIGKTNLPDGMELMLTVTKPGVTFAQDKVTVVNGGFTSSQFSASGKKYSPGRYELVVSMAMAELQPASVRAVIGERGEKMRGEFVGRGVLDELLFEWVGEGPLGVI